MLIGAKRLCFKSAVVSLRLEEHDETSVTGAKLSSPAPAELLCIRPVGADETLPPPIAHGCATANDEEEFNLVVKSVLSFAHTGFCVPVGDVDGAARHIEAILLHPDGHRALVDAARGHVDERFSVQVSMDVYRAAWRDAVDAKQRGEHHGPDASGPNEAPRPSGED